MKLWIMAACWYVGLTVYTAGLWLVGTKGRRWAGRQFMTCRRQVRLRFSRREPCDPWLDSLLRKHIDRVPGSILGMAVFVISATAWAACSVGLSNTLDPAHWTVTLPICGFALWKLAKFPPEAHDAIRSVEDSPWMQARRLLK